MNLEHTIPLGKQRTSRASLMDRAARELVHRLLRGIAGASIDLIEPAQRTRFGRAAGGDGLSCAVRVLDMRVYRRVLLGGSIGAGEAYMEGMWECDDLPALVRIFARNRRALAGLDSRWTRLAAPIHKIADTLRRNTRGGSRRNIARHYDLGNDFFALFLDESMMYSSGIFEASDSTLESAQNAKIDRICRKLDLSPEDRVIEIGTGWGGFALRAAAKHGCHVTTTTISKRQHDLARERIAAAGAGGLIDLRMEDYRDLRGQFDKLVSIEMLEAVGHPYYETFFRKCGELLRPGGKAVIQTITIADQEYERAKDEPDFIRRYIFPGGCLPSVTALCSAMTRSSTLRLVGLKDFGAHYARTLREWRARFRANLGAIRELGYSEEFLRGWEYYFCYCEGAFAEGSIGLAQLEIEKPKF